MSPLVIGFATIVAAMLIYRLFKIITGPSSPLPPGPKPWPIVGNLPHMGDEPHRALEALTKTYGPLMYLRMGFVDTVVVGSATVAEQFFKVHDANFCSRPPYSFRAEYMTYGKKDIAFAPYSPRVRFLRKISTLHMFSGKAMDDFTQQRQEEVKRLALNLARCGSKTVKLGELVNLCVANMLARIMIGQRVFNDDIISCDNGTNEFKSVVKAISELAANIDIADFIPALSWFDLQGLKTKTKELHKRHDVFLSRVLEQYKISKNKNQKELLNAMLSLQDTPQEGQSVDEADIKAIISEMFVAGTDTPSSTVEWAIAELIKNPTIMVQLQQELTNVVGLDRLVTESDLPHLPYLQAVVKETLRLHPPTPLSLPRASVESCEVFGYHIPKGATILTNIWAIGRDPKEWLDPLEFKPERFLNGSEKANVDIKGTNFEVIPFGAGRRICVGMSLAIKMVQLLIATLAHAFDWELENELDPKNLNMEEVFGLTLQRKVPLSVHPRPRLSSHVYQS